jgi:hypothetical protein
MFFVVVLNVEDAKNQNRTISTPLKITWEKYLEMIQRICVIEVAKVYEVG